MFKLIILLVTMSIVVKAYDPNTNKLIDVFKGVTKQTAHISPEILNEFKDFKNLIPTATIDEIVAKHYLVDKNFRTALKYLRSQEFSQLQRQLLDVPEIIAVLEFLHLTEVNATTGHKGATETNAAKVKASLDDYNDDDDDDAADADKRVIKMTTNTDISSRGINTTTNTSSISKTNALLAIENVKGTLNNKKVYKGPQTFQILEEHNRVSRIDDDAVDDVQNGNSVGEKTNVQQPLVYIVLLKNSKVKAKLNNEGHYKHHFYHHYHKYHHRQLSNNYHHYHSNALGTFTSFVVEVLEHLPHSAFQNMIADKCKKNPKFAEFYKALRSPEFKTIADNTMNTANIKKVIATFSSHDVDVKELKPIGFQVISWGPNI